MEEEEEEAERVILKWRQKMSTLLLVRGKRRWSEANENASIYSAQATK